MNRPCSDLAPISVSIIVSKSQLRWQSVKYFLDGLVGPLKKGEVYVGPVPASDYGSRIVAGMVAFECAVLSRGRAKGRTAIVLDLPPRPLRCDRGFSPWTGADRFLRPGTVWSLDVFLS